ncbi:MAG: VOC family protein [Ilumatobacteraceae bacterium]
MSEYRATEQTDVATGLRSEGKTLTMELMRRVVVFGAADLDAESSFWAHVLGGRVLADDGWHSVIDADGRWVIGVQLAPDHVPPVWPDGTPQQVHLDLHVDDFAAAHAEVVLPPNRMHRPVLDRAGDPLWRGRRSKWSAKLPGCNSTFSKIRVRMTCNKWCNGSWHGT